MKNEQLKLIFEQLSLKSDLNLINYLNLHKLSSLVFKSKANYCPATPDPLPSHVKQLTHHSPPSLSLNAAQAITIFNL
jgi:hypothetical protein